MLLERLTALSHKKFNMLKINQYQKSRTQGNRNKVKSKLKDGIENNIVEEIQVINEDKIIEEKRGKTKKNSQT